MRILIIILSGFIFFSCQDLNDASTSKDLIGHELMSEIKLDVILIKNIKRNGYAIEEKRNFLVDQYILNKYGIDSLQFATSIDYYSKNPKEYTYIFEVIQTNLSRLRDSIQENESEYGID